MPDLVEMSEGANENIIIYRWAFGGQAATLKELRVNFAPGQDRHIYLAGKDAYTWDGDIADFLLIGSWQGRNLEFAWSGTRLGVRQEGGTAEYSWVDLASNVDLTDIEASIALKADKTTVSALAEAVADNNAEIGSLAVLIAAKADQSAVITELATKADITALALKADKTTISNRYSLPMLGGRTDWGSYYYKDSNGWVFLSFNMIPGNGGNIARLPIGYRPIAGELYESMHKIDATGSIAITVDTNGYIASWASSTTQCVGALCFYAG